MNEEVYEKIERILIKPEIITIESEDWFNGIEKVIKSGKYGKKEIVTTKEKVLETIIKEPVTKIKIIGTNKDYFNYKVKGNLDYPLIDLIGLESYNKTFRDILIDSIKTSAKNIPIIINEQYLNKDLPKFLRTQSDFILDISILNKEETISFINNLYSYYKIFIQKELGLFRTNESIEIFPKEYYINLFSGEDGIYITITNKEPDNGFTINLKNLENFTFSQLDEFYNDNISVWKSDKSNLNKIRYKSDKNKLIELGLHNVEITGEEPENNRDLLYIYYLPQTNRFKVGKTVNYESRIKSYKSSTFDGDEIGVLKYFYYAKKLNLKYPNKELDNYFLYSQEWLLLSLLSNEKYKNYLELSENTREYFKIKNINSDELLKEIIKDFEELMEPLTTEDILKTGRNARNYIRNFKEYIYQKGEKGTSNYLKFIRNDKELKKVCEDNDLHYLLPAFKGAKNESKIKRN